MSVEYGPPPTPTTYNSYEEFFTALLSKPGEWVSVPLGDISGSTPRNKQITIHTAAHKRGVRVRTTVQDGRFYARIHA